MTREAAPTDPLREALDDLQRGLAMLEEHHQQHHAELAALTAPAAPWCPVHQHYKACKHNGGVMKDSGYEWPAALALDVERLALRDHEWSMANGRVHCAHHYVPVRPCSPEDHMEWAAAIAAAYESDG